jgi:hypothetical protein
MIFIVWQMGVIVVIRSLPRALRADVDGVRDWFPGKPFVAPNVTLSGCWQPDYDAQASAC